MRIKDLSLTQLAKRAYTASLKLRDISNTFGYDERAAANGDFVNARGQILTRKIATKDTSLMSSLIKNPVLTQILLDSIQRGSEAMVKWTNSLITKALPNNSGHSNSISGPDSLLNAFQKSEPTIQASGHFLRAHFQVKSVKVARAAVDFLKIQKDHAQTIAQQIVTDEFQGPQLPDVQIQVDALQAGEIDITTFATDSLRHNLGLYSFDQYDHAISKGLVERLNDQFGHSADTVNVDMIVAFQEATPEVTPAVDYTIPVRAESHAFTPRPKF